MAESEKKARMSVKVACLCEGRDIKLFYTIKLGRKRGDTKVAITSPYSPGPLV